MRRDPWRDSFPDISDLKSKLSGLIHLARLCNLVLNPDAAQPLARLLSRLSRLFRLSSRFSRPNFQTLARLSSRFSRPNVQTFQTQLLGVTLQLGSKSGCGATLGATQVQIFQSFCPDFPDSNSWRDAAIWV